MYVYPLLLSLLSPLSSLFFSLISSSLSSLSLSPRASDELWKRGREEIRKKGEKGKEGLFIPPPRKRDAAGGAFLSMPGSYPQTLQKWVLTIYPYLEYPRPGLAGVAVRGAALNLVTVQVSGKYLIQ